MCTRSRQEVPGRLEGSEDNSSDISGTIQRHFAFPQRGVAPPPMSGHLLSRTGAGTCMMRYGPKFYDGGVVIRYVTIASRGVKNEPEGHSFGSVATPEKGNNHGTNCAKWHRCAWIGGKATQQLFIPISSNPFRIYIPARLL